LVVKGFMASCSLEELIKARCIHKWQPSIISFPSNGGVPVSALNVGENRIGLYTLMSLLISTVLKI
jgi:hypothetical protein